MLSRIRTNIRYVCIHLSPNNTGNVSDTTSYTHKGWTRDSTTCDASITDSRSWFIDFYIHQRHQKILPVSIPAPNKTVDLTEKYKHPPSVDLPLWKTDNVVLIRRPAGKSKICSGCFHLLRGDCVFSTHLNQISIAGCACKRVENQQFINSMMRCRTSPNIRG